MVRVTSAVASRRRRKRILKAASGYYGDRKNHTRLSKDARIKAMEYATIHRKQKKRFFRSLWITRLSSAAKLNGLSYSRLIDGLAKAECKINRKMLSELASKDPAAFAVVAETAKKALA